MASVIITDRDMERLLFLIRIRDYNRNCNLWDMHDLRRLLDRAVVVGSRHIPADIITMNTKFECMDKDTGMRETMRIVFPEDAGGGRDRISVLSPSGTELLGRRVGTPFVLCAPQSQTPRRAFITGIIYQPEAAGHYHL